MLEGGKINHFVALLCDGFCGEYITLYYRIVLNFQLIAESGGQLCLTKKQGVHAMKYNMINIKNIFKVSLLSFVVWQSSLFDAFAADANDLNLVVPVVCADGNTNRKYEQCIKTCENIKQEQLTEKSCHKQCSGSTGGGGNNTTCNTVCSSATYRYVSSNILGGSFSSEIFSYDNGNQKNQSITKCKTSCEIFKNQCSSYVVKIMDLMSAMPEIGISRVDPNLIEY